jgi:NAD(P)-dependent dehydrogenase (short-subunit alcohol dehydrogenase family)
MFDLTGKTALITGGAGLLGKKHAEAVIEFGATAIVADYNIQEAELVCQELGESAIPVYIDVNNKSDIEKAIGQFDKIDILINNAAKDPKVTKSGGLSPETRFESMTEEFWHDGISTILNGTFLCSQSICNKMLKTGGGVIINIASDLGVIAPDQRLYKQEGLTEQQQNVKPITYSAAKWGVIGMTKYLATYFADKNIRVNSLCPAGVYDNHPEEFVERFTNLIPMGRMANVDEYKGAIVFLCSDASSYMTGSNLIIDGGRTSW